MGIISWFSTFPSQKKNNPKNGQNTSWVQDSSQQSNVWQHGGGTSIFYKQSMTQGYISAITKTKIFFLVSILILSQSIHHNSEFIYKSSMPN